MASGNGAGTAIALAEVNPSRAVMSYLSSLARHLVLGAVLCLALPVGLRAQDSTVATAAPDGRASVPSWSKRAVTPSFSVAPRGMLMRRGPRGMRMNTNSSMLWLSANVHDLLPDRVAPAWPAAVRLSVGRREFASSNAAEYVLGLDVDASRLPGNHPAWVRTKALLHAVRLPGPALVVGPYGTRRFGLYW